MSIYTKSGDEGNTYRPGGEKIRKSDALCEAMGSIDELNSHIGLCIQGADAAKQDYIKDALAPLQCELLTVGAIFASAGTGVNPNVRLYETAVERIEKQIDSICGKLPKLTHFILPDGCELACRLQIARTVCRRAERRVVSSKDAGLDVAGELLTYINRLGDLLFALARLANHETGYEDDLWRP